MTPRVFPFTVMGALLLACGGATTSGDGSSFGDQGSIAGPASSSSSTTPSPTPTNSVQTTTVVSSGFADATAVLALGPNLFVTTSTTVLAGVKTQNGGLFLIPKAGGEPLLLAVDHRGAAYTDLALEDNDVLVATSDGRINRVPLYGGTETEVMNGAPPIISIASDGSRIYYAHAAGSVISIDENGQNADLLASPGAVIRAISLAAKSLYVAYDDTKTGALVSIDVSTPGSVGAPATVAPTSGTLCGLSVANESAYMTSLAGTVFSAKLQGGAVSQVASAQASPCGVLTDTSYVYWLASDGAGLFRAGINGGNAQALAQIPNAALSAHSIAIDDDAVYVLAQTEVVRVAK